MKDNLILDNFIEVLASEKGLAVNTRTSYRNDIVQLLNFLKKNEKNLEDLDSSDIEKFISKFKNQGFEKVTISRKLSALSHFFIFLEDTFLVYLGSTNLPPQLFIIFKT